MEHIREVKNELTWHSTEGKFTCTLINGNITELNFCEPGKSGEDCGRCIVSTDYKFLQQVHTSLGELFKFIEDENKKLGYSFPNET